MQTDVKGGCWRTCEKVRGVTGDNAVVDWLGSQTEHPETGPGETKEPEIKHPDVHCPL